VDIVNTFNLLRAPYSENIKGAFVMVLADNLGASLGLRKVLHKMVFSQPLAKQLANASSVLHPHTYIVLSLSQLDLLPLYSLSSINLKHSILTPSPVNHSYIPPPVTTRAFDSTFSLDHGTLISYYYYYTGRILMQLLMRAAGAFLTRTPADFDCNVNTLLTDSDNGKRIGVKRGWAFNYVDQLQVIQAFFHRSLSIVFLV
jgi:hypothetical protein